MKDYFKTFLESDKGKDYVKQILNGATAVTINVDDMEPDFVQLLLENASYMEDFKEAFDDIIYQYDPNKMRSFDIYLVGNSIPLVKIRDITAKLVNHIVKIRGLVNRISIIRPCYKEAVFECMECGTLSSPIPQTNPFFLFYPAKCPSCAKRDWEVKPELSNLIDSQEFTLQELHTDIESASIPRRIPMITFKSNLLNYADCGDQVEVIGIVKLTSPLRRKGRATRFAEPYIEVISIKKENKNPEEYKISDEDLQKIIEISKKPDPFEYLKEQLAPSLYGLDWAKRACLLSLFGGVQKIKKDIQVRGNINVLLVGDPSVGKSQLLKACANLAPRGIYATGRGVSAAGLTALACIDEIDKMRKEDRVNIHEAMEQQVVSISKAGIHATLNARTAVVAAANPLFGVYDKTKFITDNIGGNFPPTLLNRFDLIFILTDKNDEEFDRRVLEVISSENEKMLDRELFTKYIAYAKRIKPKLTATVKAKLYDYFLKIRRQIRKSSDERGEELKTMIPITFRQYEALIRIAEAHARARLSDKVEEKDADFTIKIFNEFLSNIEYDVTGLETGKSKTLRDILKAILDIVSDRKEWSINDIVAKMQERGFKDEGKIKKSIAQLINEGKLYESNPNFYKKT